MRRWVGVGLGCVTALGMQALFRALGGFAGVGSSLVLGYTALFLALVIGGYVAGYLVGRLQIFYGALAAVAFIFVSVTVDAAREAALARQLGLAGLPAIDFVQLTLTDVVAMVGASCGGWLAGRF
ncbi:MAG: hypothetical protein JOZ81_26465 [Chloroflexi bacterium]|nr:hypothetical protein [Chloroflexota bacterium]